MMKEADCAAKPVVPASPPLRPASPPAYILPARRAKSHGSAVSAHQAIGAPSFDPLVVKPSYIFGETLPGGETQTIEFKSGDGGRCGDTAGVVKDKAARYIGAFLNSCGGVVLFGVEDDGSVPGCELSDAQRVAITKLIDMATECIDPQPDVGAIRHRYAPVGGCPDGAARHVIVLEVAPDAARQQPVYYSSRWSMDANIRRAECVQPLTAALAATRETEFRAAGRPVRLTWRHVVARALPFDEHIEGLRALATQPRVRLVTAITDAVLDADDVPASRVVALVGEPGVGKSSLLASLVTHGRQKRPEAEADGWRNLSVCGWHFCISGNAETTGASGFVCNFAAALAASTFTGAFRRLAA